MGAVVTCVKCCRENESRVIRQNTGVSFNGMVKIRCKDLREKGSKVQEVIGLKGTSKITLFNPPK